MSNVLIITIVKQGWGDKVLEASFKAGAEGGTILLGRGAGVHEKQKILGIPIEPEKEILLTITDREKSEAILRSITQTCNLERPGAGLSFIVPVDKVIGIAHRISRGEEGTGD